MGSGLYKEKAIYKNAINYLHLETIYIFQIYIIDTLEHVVSFKCLIDLEN